MKPKNIPFIKSLKKLLFLSGLLFVLFQVTVAQPGTVDSDFNADGKVLLDISGDNDYVYAADVQDDGKIVAAGRTANGGDLADFVVVRYNPDGSLDESFSLDGIAVTNMLGNNDYAGSVTIQSDGKIVVAGTAYDSSRLYVAMARYNADGSLDESFDDDGKLVSAIDTGYTGAASVKIQTDGKIVISGYSNSDCLLARYMEDGTVDSTFGENGKVLADFGETEYFASLVIQPDGKFVAAGYTEDPSEYSDIIMERFNSDGSPDVSFGVNGQVIGEFNDIEEISSIVLQPDGKILAAGNMAGVFSATLDDIFLIRYNTDGSLDESFAEGGIEIFDYDNTSEYGQSVALQTDGKILVAGTIWKTNLDYDFLLLRYHKNGTLDETFGDNGIVMTDFSGERDYGQAVTMQPDGRIVMAGYSRNSVGGDNDFAVVRYLSGVNIEVGNLKLYPENHQLLVYPNPVKTNTVLEFTLSEDETVSVNLYDLQGRLQQVFIQHQPYSSGNHKVQLTLNRSVVPGNYMLVIGNEKGNQSIQVTIR